MKVDFLEIYENLNTLALQQRATHNADRSAFDGLTGGVLNEAVRALAWAWSHYVAQPVLEARHVELSQNIEAGAAEAKVMAAEQRAVEKMPHLRPYSTALVGKSKSLARNIEALARERDAVAGALRRISVDPPKAGWRQQAIRFLPQLRQISPDDPACMDKIKAIVGAMVSTPFG